MLDPPPSRRRPSPDTAGSSGDHRRRLGALGEELAAKWYRAHGYSVVDRNWRCAAGELDLVCTRGRLLVVCEVKSRGSDAFGAPAEAVSWAKRRRLRRSTARWLAAPRPARFRPDQIRFDVAEVRVGRVEVIEGAF